MLNTIVQHQQHKKNNLNSPVTTSLLANNNFFNKQASNNYYNNYSIKQMSSAYQSNNTTSTSPNIAPLTMPSSMDVNKSDITLPSIIVPEDNHTLHLEKLQHSVPSHNSSEAVSTPQEEKDELTRNGQSNASTAGAMMKTQDVEEEEEDQFEDDISEDSDDSYSSDAKNSFTVSNVGGSAVRANSSSVFSPFNSNSTKRMVNFESATSSLLEQQNMLNQESSKNVVHLETPFKDHQNVMIKTINRGEKFQSSMTITPPPAFTAKLGSTTAIQASISPPHFHQLSHNGDMHSSFRGMCKQDYQTSGVSCNTTSVTSSNCNSPSKFDDETNHGFPYERAFCPSCFEKATKGNLTFCTQCITSKGHKVRRLVECEVCKDHIRYNYYYQHLHKAHIDFLKEKYPRCVYLKQMKDGTKQRRVRRQHQNQPLLAMKAAAANNQLPSLLHLMHSAAHGEHATANLVNNNNIASSITSPPVNVTVVEHAEVAPSLRETQSTNTMECDTPTSASILGIVQLQKAAHILERKRARESGDSNVEESGSILSKQTLCIDEDTVPVNKVAKTVENQRAFTLPHSIVNYRQKFCPCCGIRFGDVHKFCSECGTKRE